jgi:hypothetical protein
MMMASHHETEIKGRGIFSKQGKLFPTLEEIA